MEDQAHRSSGIFYPQSQIEASPIWSEHRFVVWDTYGLMGAFPTPTSEYKEIMPSHAPAAALSRFPESLCDSILSFLGS